MRFLARLLIIFMLFGGGVHAQDRSVQEFVEAAFRGDLKAVQSHIEDGMDANARNRDGFTGLLVATQAGHADIVTFLIDSGADVTLENDEGTFPLYMAAQEGHDRLVDILLAAGADPKRNRLDGSNAVSVAAQVGAKTIVERFLKAGVPVNHLPPRGAPAIYMAAQEGHVDLVRYLLENGADINLASVNGQTPLIGAALNGHLAMTNLLIAQGADLDVESETRQTALSTAAQNAHFDVAHALLMAGAGTEISGGLHPSALFSAVEHGNTRLVAALIERGANVNFIDSGVKRGATPLIAAVLRGDPQIIKMLLDAGAETDIATQFEALTALHFSVGEGSIENVELLLERGADPNLQATDGRTPLLIATYQERAAVVELLLANGADPSLALVDGRTAADLATDARIKAALGAVPKVETDPAKPEFESAEAKLFAAIEQGNEALLKEAVSEGASINARSPDGVLPLHAAILERNPTAVRYLSDRGANLDWPATFGLDVSDDLVAASIHWIAMTEVAQLKKQISRLEKRFRGEGEESTDVNEALAARLKETEAKLAKSEERVAAMKDLVDNSMSLIKEYEKDDEERIGQMLGQLENFQSRATELASDFQKAEKIIVSLQSLVDVSSPEAVRFVQDGLIALNFDPGVADGKLGQQTLNAIIEFERANNRAPTGKITFDLISVLAARSGG